MTLGVAYVKVIHRLQVFCYTDLRVVRYLCYSSASCTKLTKFS